jgi:ASC-1-like (ASCH) protein
VKSTLHLNLRRKYFAAIAAGTKSVEYRARKPYWRKRLEDRKYDVIKFRNGYATKAPEMIVEFRGLRKRGRNYEILLGRILKIKRWKP